MLNVTLRQLRVFVTIAETGGFGAAATQLDIAQTSVSAHVQALEEQLGRAVFLRRLGRRPVRTAFGEVLLTHATRILAETDALLSRARDLDAVLKEQVVFACQRYLAHHMVPSVLAGFAREHPGAELVTRVGTQEDVLAQVASGVATLGCFLGDHASDSMPSQVIGRERYVLAVARSHALAQRPAVGAAELEGFAFVGAPQDSLFGKAMSRILHEAGIRHVNLVTRATEYQVLRQLAIAGVGIACLGQRSTIQDVASGALVVLPFEGPELTMEVRLVFGGRRLASAATRSLVLHLRRYWDAP